MIRYPRTQSGLIHVEPKFESPVWLLHKSYRLPSSLETCSSTVVISFEARGAHNVGLCLNASPSRVIGGDREFKKSQKPAYEVVVGSHLNTRSAIRRLGKEKAVLTRDENRHGVVPENKSKFHRYWIAFDGRRLALGRGRREWLDPRDLLLFYEDPKPLGVRYVGLLTWDTPVQYRSLSVGFLNGSQDLCALLLNNNDGMTALVVSEDDGSVSSSARAAAIRSAAAAAATHPLFSFVDQQFLSDVSFDHCEPKLCAHRVVLQCVCPFLLQSDAASAALDRNTLLLALQLVYSVANDERRDIMLHALRRVDSIEALVDLVDSERSSGNDGAADASSSSSSLPLQSELGQSESSKRRRRRRRRSSSLRMIEDDFSFLASLWSDAEGRPLDEHTDVAFKLDDGATIRAHKIVLATQSRVFKAMLQSGMRETLRSEVALHDVGMSTLRSLLCFYYTGSSMVPDGIEQCMLLVVLADRFETSTRLLRDDGAAWRYLFASGGMNADNCGKALAVIDYFGLPLRLYTRAVAFARKHFEPVSLSSGFVKYVPFHVLIDLIHSDDVAVPSERVVFTAVVRWLAADMSGRAQHAREVINYVRLRLIDPCYLRAALRADPLFVGNAELVELVQRGAKLEVRSATSRSSPSLPPLQLDAGGGAPMNEAIDGEAIDGAAQQLLVAPSLSLGVDGSTNSNSAASSSSQSPSAAAAAADLLSGAQHVATVVGPEEHFIAEKGVRARDRNRTGRSRRFVERLFAHVGDSNGIFYYLGTSKSSTRWLNPYRTSAVDVQLSCPESRYCERQVFVGSSYRSTSFIGGSPPWLVVDLGAEHACVPTAYSLQIDASPDLLRNWRLQGAAARSANDWHDLSAHVDDETFVHAGQFGRWAITDALVGLDGFRYFRLLMDGPSSTGDTHKLCICRLELYGYLIEINLEK
jgi:BTB And C-terminal Kelch/BTB/POZ domain/Farnesoic acid 0-methyl transferase